MLGFCLFVCLFDFCFWWGFVCLFVCFALFCFVRGLRIQVNQSTKIDCLTSASRGCICISASYCAVIVDTQVFFLVRIMCAYKSR